MQHSSPQYVLGRSETESQRLVKQADFLRPSTERVFRKAGIKEGMHVLDLGCGAGDVSFLAAELVGPTGSVVGIDVDPGVLAVARVRRKQAVSHGSDSRNGPSTASRRRNHSMRSSVDLSSSTRPIPSQRFDTFPAW